MAKSFVQNVAKNIQTSRHSYTILGRIANMVEWNQRGGQHEFQSTKRVEEHLPTLNVILDSFFLTRLFNGPAIVDFQPCFSKAFDRVNWESNLA